MPTLRITVDWLDRTYHGVEWPPSPLRLYQAMIAGYSVHRRGDRALEAAMRHLETLPEPTIFAPEAEERSPVKSAVPNNDGDRALDLFAKGNHVAARTRISKALTTRVRCSRSFDGVVTYDWDTRAETPRHLPALEAIATSVSAVGQGIDAALARVELMERAGPVTGVQYTPSSTGGAEIERPLPWSI